MAKTKTRTVRVLVKKPGEAPEIQEIDGSLAAMQKIVGGYVQCVPINELGGVDLYCDEEGKLKENARQNFLIFGGRDVVVGTAFFVARRGSGVSSLTEKQEQRVRDWLNS